jgi:hypothetical protein
MNNAWQILAFLILLLFPVIGKAQTINNLKKDSTKNDFTSSLFFEYRNGIGKFKNMSYRFEVLSDQKRKYIYKYSLPSYIEQQDTLEFIVNFQEVEKSMLIKRDVIVIYEKYLPDQKKSERKTRLRIDTFPLVFMDSLVVDYQKEEHSILKFRGYVADFQCHTFYINRDLGVFKRYGPHYSDTIEHELLKGTENYNFWIKLLDDLDASGEFHDNCDGHPLWVKGSKWPSQRKKKKRKRN